jgi:RNA polymerase sigma-70 factor, ECF subfamily
MEVVSQGTAHAGKAKGLPHMIQREATRFAAANEASSTLDPTPDPEHFGALYERYRDRIHAYLRSRTTSEEDAADLTQQVFAQALGALPRYRARQLSFGAWLFRIARNVAVDFHRRRKATVPLDLVPEALQPAATEDTASRVLEEESLARLRELFIALNAESRELLTLRFVGQLTAPEIAAVLGISEAAIRKRLTRLLQSLKERYDEPTH